MSKEIIVRKVWVGGNNQLLISLPKGKGIVKGDYVVIKKLKNG